MKGQWPFIIYLFIFYLPGSSVFYFVVKKYRRSLTFYTLRGNFIYEAHLRTRTTQRALQQRSENVQKECRIDLFFYFC